MDSVGLASNFFEPIWEITPIGLGRKQPYQGLGHILFDQPTQVVVHVQGLYTGYILDWYVKRSTS